MEIFWDNIAAYNAATWPVQVVLTLVAAVLTVLLYRRPSPAVRMAMKGFMALINFWIAIVYYHVFSSPYDYHDPQALFWIVMGIIWIYDMTKGRTLLERTEGHSRFALMLFMMPLAYPLFSLALGREFPMMTLTIMPCSVVVFTVGLMLAFSERVHIVLAMLLCHWTLTGLLKVYYFGIPEDYLLACSVVPALFFFFSEYIRRHAGQTAKPSTLWLRILFVTLCVVVGIAFLATLLHQFGLFAEIFR